ncbi:lipase member H-B-like [Amyelois transitella]|uniref:lipase member H-B-like n=1 Tax=Amyelois transitella TaxID=680683 RepID=UPI0029902D9B|nr:lipase member H-B-like [Amyelois transitella]
MSTKEVIVIFLAFSILSHAGSWDHRSEEGYPKGLMSVCPGSTKPARIPSSQLKYLQFVVQGKNRTRRRYTYWTAQKIAQDPRMDFKRKTMLIALGYLDSTNFPISSMLANEYEGKGYNVILVDNQRFATVHYYLAARLMRPVGKHVAEILAKLTRQGLDPSKLELTGFSLGCHTVSYIAKNFKQITGKTITKITALEPSGPCFRHLPPNDRLDHTDAEFVEVIHTNIDGFGMAVKMGHVDFYVNGGEFQPTDLLTLPCAATCSHFRVLPIWVSALNNPKSFIAIKCQSIQQARDSNCYNNTKLETNLLGPNVNKSNHGVFYLATSLDYPYYLGENGLKEEYAAWRRITDVNDGNETEVYT